MHCLVNEAVCVRVCVCVCSNLLRTCMWWLHHGDQEVKKHCVLHAISLATLAYLQHQLTVYA